MPTKFITSIKENREKWLVTCLTGLFMFMVLYVYKGYNVDQTASYSGHGLLFRAIADAASTSLLFFVSEFYAIPHLKIKSSKQYFVWTIVIILIGINFTFLLFNYFWQWTEFNWKSYGLFYYEYPLVVCFPILVARLIGNGKSKTIANQEYYMYFESDNKKNRFKIKPEYLLYLQSSDNYVEIYYLLNGELKKHLLRNSLKEIEQIYNDSPYLVRCHRSFMVNPKNIVHIFQDTKGTNLNVGHSSIPVSKKYLPNFQ